MRRLFFFTRLFRRFLTGFLTRLLGAEATAKEAQRPGDPRNRNPTSCATSSSEQVRAVLTRKKTALPKSREKKGGVKTIPTD